MGKNMTKKPEREAQNARLYQSPNIELVSLSGEDVCTLSGAQQTGGKMFNGYKDDGWF
ncbi:MAG: hypothetical protein IJB97_02870 [Clostridia bacterium]|nr:hypothetical protein [Clostridia bacterium]